MAPMTMPAVTPPERPLLPDGEGDGVELAVAETAAFGVDDDALADVRCAEAVEETLLLSSAPDLVAIGDEEMGPISVREADGAGVLSSVRVPSSSGAGACTRKSEGCWQLRKPSRLKQQFHLSFVVS